MSSVTTKTVTTKPKRAYNRKSKGTTTVKTISTGKSTYTGKKIPAAYKKLPYKTSITLPMMLFDCTKYKENVFPLPNSIGVSICQNFVNRTSVTPSSGALTPTTIILLFTSSELIGVQYNRNTVNSICTKLTNPQFLADIPSHKRNSRMTVNLLNTSSGTNVAGSITVMQTKAALEWEFSGSTANFEVSPTFMDEIEAMLNTSSSSKQYTAIQAQEGLKFSLLPISMVALQTFDNPRPTADPSPLPAGQANLDEIKNILHETTNTASHGALVIRFDPVANQNYSLEVYSQFATRHPPNTLLGSLGKKQPTLSAQTLQSAIEAAGTVSAVGEHHPEERLRASAIPMAAPRSQPRVYGVPLSTIRARGSSS